MTQNQFMQQAIALSIQNVQNGKGGPFAAVVVKDGRVIAQGTNQVTSQNDPTAHAEVVAIREACKTLQTFQLDGCEVYTTCEPCPMCLGAIYWARPAKIYFANTREDAAKIGFDDEFLYNEMQQAIAQRQIPTIQIMRDEALVAFHDWQAKSDKITY